MTRNKQVEAFFRRLKMFTCAMPVVLRNGGVSNEGAVDFGDDGSFWQGYDSEVGSHRDLNLSGCSIRSV